MAKSHDTFETLAVLAVVAIVAVAGQVLVSYNEGITGFSVIEPEPTDTISFGDVSVEKIQVSPESPLIGEPFEVTVTVKNEGTTEIRTPFYVEVSFDPTFDGADYDKATLRGVMTKILAPGESAQVGFLVAAVLPEGPLRILATADSTAKIIDENTANNQRSYTLIVAAE